MTSLDTIKEMLREAPLFASFSTEQIDLLADCAVQQTFESGSYLIRDGETANQFYLIRHGTVALELSAPPNGRITVQTLHENELLGWSWLIPPYRWSFDGRAFSLVRTLTFDAARLRLLFESNHTLGYRMLNQFIQVMAGRIIAARVQMVDLYAPGGATKA